MTEADRVRSTPPLRLSSSLAEQQQHRTASIATLTHLRREARDEIARLIEFIDASDPYVMTEIEQDDEAELDVDAEPSLGSFDRMHDQTKSWRQRGPYVTGDDIELDDSDREPSLAAIENHPKTPSTRLSYFGELLIMDGPPDGEWRDGTGSQAHWGVSATKDLEDGHDGREPDPDEEDSLGWTEAGAHGLSGDREIAAAPRRPQARASQAKA